MSDIQAIGDAITGGVIGRAVEPSAGEGADGHTHEHVCLNCGAALHGPFCQQCGQHAHVHRTLGAFFHDFAHGVLHFEGKIWRTLPLLVWKPGELTRRYVEGQRASFVSPVALFLFSVFLMFAVLSATGGLNPSIVSNTDLTTQQRDAQADLSRLQKQRADLVARHLPTAALDKRISDAQDAVDLFTSLRQSEVKSPGQGKNMAITTDVPWLKPALAKAKENPDLLLYKLKSNSYKWSWALIPLSVPFVWLLFPFSRRFRVYDHVVFVTYSLSFMTFLVTFGALISALGADGVVPFLPLVPPVHMYRQLRGAYALSVGGALWRTLFLVIFAVMVLAGFIALMTMLGVLD